MAFINRRTGIAGVTAGALVCLICGIPFIAAFLGVGGISVAAILSGISIELKIAVSIASVAIVALLVYHLIKKRSEKTQKADV